MNVYNFIYSIFYRFWENKIGNARILGAALVTFTLVMHMLFLSELVRLFSPLKKAVKTSYEEMPVLRDAYWLVIVLTVVVVYFIYTPDRTARLAREFEVRHSEDLLGNILKVLFYLIIPTVGGIYLAMTNHRAFY